MEIDTSIYCVIDDYGHDSVTGEREREKLDFINTYTYTLKSRANFERTFSIYVRTNNNLFLVAVYPRLPNYLYVFFFQLFPLKDKKSRIKLLDLCASRVIIYRFSSFNVVARSISGGTKYKNGELKYSDVSRVD